MLKAVGTGDVESSASAPAAVMDKNTLSRFYALETKAWGEKVVREIPRKVSSREKS